MNSTVKKILGWLAIFFIVVLTFTLIKRLPSILKVLILGVNVLTIYYAYTKLILIKKEKKEEK